jgi:hypothetical protein
MPKPSIFSRDYDERMRKRKKRRLILGIVVVLVIVIFVFIGIIGNFSDKKSELGLEKLKTKIATKLGQNDSEKEKDKKDEIANNTDSNKEVVKEENKSKEESSSDKASTGKTNEIKDATQVGEQIIKLSNGEEVKLQYSMINTEKQYVGVSPKTINYDISPSKKNIVLVENTTQNMLIVDVNGAIKDITKKQYISSKGTTFDKDKVLALNKSYIWCSSPKFLNEDTILYTSQLPWFNKETTKFLWKYNISSNKHQHNILPQGGEIQGEEVIYGSITSAGIEVLVDGKKIIIK